MISIKFRYKSERIKERIKVTIYGEAEDFDNTRNPLSLLLFITFSSVRPRSRFQVVVSRSSLFFHKSLLMNKYTETFGIDISKDVFDCYGSIQGHLQFKNTEKGFNKFLQLLSKDSLVVMEVTGYYHYRLAQFLHHKNKNVSVVNPLSVKRFIQMKLAKVKTDKSDSKAICAYALIK